MYLSKEEHIRNRTLSALVSGSLFILMIVFFMVYKLITPDPPFPIGNNINYSGLTLAAVEPNTNAINYDQMGNASNVSKEELLTTEENNVHLAQKITRTKQLSTVEQLALKFKTHTTKTTNGIEAGEQGDPNSMIKGTVEIGERSTCEITKGFKFDLAGSKLIHFPGLPKETNEEGKVVVNIVVDHEGNVIDAEPNGRGTTTSSALLKAKARQTALATKFNSDTKNTERRGSITIIFAFE